MLEFVFYWKLPILVNLATKFWKMLRKTDLDQDYNSNQELSSPQSWTFASPNKQNSYIQVKGHQFNHKMVCDDCKKFMIKLESTILPWVTRENK